jgi:hypothetical protein
MRLHRQQTILGQRELIDKLSGRWSAMMIALLMVPSGDAVDEQTNGSRGSECGKRRFSVDAAVLQLSP